MGKASRRKKSVEHRQEMGRRELERAERSANTTRVGNTPTLKRTHTTTDVAAALKRKQKADRRAVRRFTEQASGGWRR